MEILAHTRFSVVRTDRLWQKTGSSPSSQQSTSSRSAAFVVSLVLKKLLDLSPDIVVSITGCVGLVFGAVVPRDAGLAVMPEGDGEALGTGWRVRETLVRMVVTQ